MGRSNKKAKTMKMNPMMAAMMAAMQQQNESSSDESDRPRARGSVVHQHRQEDQAASSSVDGSAVAVPKAGAVVVADQGQGAGPRSAVASAMANLDQQCASLYSNVDNSKKIQRNAVLLRSIPKVLV